MNYFLQSSIHLRAVLLERGKKGAGNYSFMQFFSSFYGCEVLPWIIIKRGFELLKNVQWLRCNKKLYLYYMILMGFKTWNLWKLGVFFFISWFIISVLTFSNEIEKFLCIRFFCLFVHTLHSYKVFTLKDWK